MQNEDLPPPYVPPKTTAGTPVVTAVTVINTFVVPRWIILYAMAVKPAVWVVQRVAIFIVLLDDYGKKDFSSTVLAIFAWNVLTMVVAGLVYTGGTLVWAKPERRPRLLRFGIGCCVALDLLVVGFVILSLGAALSSPPPENEMSDRAFAALLAAAALWLAGFVAECVAWLRLGRTGTSAARP